MTVRNLNIVNQICKNVVGVISERGRKPVSTEGIQKVELQVEEVEVSYLHACTRFRQIALAVDILRSTDKNIMKVILWCYPYKIQPVQKFLLKDFETRHRFS